MKQFTILLLASLYLATTPGQAQPAGEPIPVWPGIAPGSEHWTQQEVEWTQGANKAAMVRNVVRPTLTPFLPEPGKASGIAVIICPGGAFRFLSWWSEGTAVAEYLQARGVAAFVLKYRLEETPANPEEFRTNMLGTATGARSNTNRANVRELAAADARQAVKLVRRRCGEWGVQPERIGLLGFSAGGVTTMAVVMGREEDSRVNFAAPIYGGGTGGKPVPTNAPPLFICAADDDRSMAAGSAKLYSEWKAAGRPAELHIYAKGGHGFGMQKKNLPTDGWIDRFADWLAVQGLLKPGL